MMLKKWTRTVALLLAVLFCLSSCSKAEKVDYDTNPLSFETVFDDTPGNPDKPDTVFVETRYNALPAHCVRVYEFEEDTICKGAFYVLPPEYSYVLEDILPEEGIIKGVFTFDYTKKGDDICIHSFTLSYETAEGITIRNPEVYAVDLARTPVVDNQISLKHLRILSRKPSSNIFFSGSFDYKGEEHSFQIDL